MITPVGTTTYEYRGLSTDKKPVENVGNGSVFFEMDTCNLFMFDEASKEWKKIN